MPNANWELLSAAREGDGEALAQLLALADERIRNALSERPLPALPQGKFSDSDIVQESLIDIVADLSTFRGHTEQEFQQWAMRIAHHNRTDARRKFLAAEQRNVQREVALDDVEELFDPHESPDGAAQRTENDQQLDDAIARLPERWRTAIHFRHEQQLGWEEIGRQLNISADAARKLWVRAVKRLQAQLSSEESRLG